MTQRKVRARDVDRDVAIDIVEAAWADGQLTREEYDRRVDRLLKAPTLNDLEREVIDLQPEGVNWQPRTAGVPAARPTSPPLIDANQKRRNRRVPIALTLMVLVVVGLATRSAFTDEFVAAPRQQTQLVSTPSMLSSAGFMAAREELDRHAGNDSVYSAELTDERFEVVRPTSAAGTSAIREVFEDGQWIAGEPASSDGERLSLGLVNAEAIATILDGAHQNVGEHVALKLLFQIARQADQRVCITATPVGSSAWTGRYDCRGQEVTN